MRLALVGLGKMGSNLCLNLQDHGHQVVVYDIDPTLTKKMGEYGALSAKSMQEAIRSLDHPRVVWLMVPAGDIVDTLIDQAKDLLEPGDIIIDGGNSLYTQTQRRGEQLEASNIHYVDIGTSGGIDGARHGACMMVGGSNEAVSLLEPVLKDVCVEDGFLHCGPSGSGHFVKMVHNGIEYGIMQAIGEGFALMDKAEFDLDLSAVAKVFCNGSVIRGWLMDLTYQVFQEDPKVSKIKGMINSSGEGQWTVETALKLGVPVPVIAQSLFVRFSSLEEDGFSNKVVAALRKQFGGHAVHEKS